MSAEIVDLRGHRDEMLDMRWNAYVAAQRRAQASLHIEDGKAAGRAWRQWLDLWMNEDQREWTGGKNGR